MLNNTHSNPHNHQALDFNTTLETIRTLAPDLNAIQQRLGWLDAQTMDPIVCGYLDGHCPGWRQHANRLTLACGSCGHILSRPTRLTDAPQDFDWDAQSYTPPPVVESGYHLQITDDNPYASSLMLRWNGKPARAAGVLLNPDDTRGYMCDDGGCCGYAGQPGNCVCIACGATVGTLHTDCCALHYFHTHDAWTHTSWGLPAPTAAEEAVLATLAGLDHTRDDPNSAALNALWKLPYPLSPTLEAMAMDLLGPIGALEVHREGPDGGWSMGWSFNHEDCGRHTHTRVVDGHTLLTQLAFYGPGGLPCGPYLMRVPGRPGYLAWYDRDHNTIASWTIPESAIPALATFLDEPNHIDDVEMLRRWLTTIGVENGA
ncbi:MAG: hypothetical protein AAFX99_12250 [Myxococcota bacterium]